MIKNIVRLNNKKIRLKYSKSYVEKESYAVSNNLITNLLPILSHKDNIYALYSPINNEIDTKFIANYLKNNNSTICYPKIIDNKMVFLQESVTTKFSYNKNFNKLLEPITGNIITPNIIITPLLAFDHDLNRIGYGQGYYDKYFKNLKNNFIAIGLAYENQKTKKSINFSSNDQKLNYVVTKTAIYKKN